MSVRVDVAGLVGTLDAAVKSQGHLHFKDGKWVSSMDKPTEKWAETLKKLRETIKSTDLDSDQIVTLTKSVKIIHANEKMSFARSVVFKNDAQAESIEFRDLILAINSRSNVISKLSIERYFLNLNGYKNDINAFAYLYSVSFDRSDDEREQVHALVEQLARENPSCTWLRRCAAEPNWLASIAQNADTKKEYPKTLDLKDLDPDTIIQVLRAHSTFTDLRIILNLKTNTSSNDLQRILEHCQNVTYLDLSQCKALNGPIEWPKLEKMLVELKSLNYFVLPPCTSKIGYKDEADFISSKWSKPMQVIVQQRLIAVLYRRGEPYTYKISLQTLISELFNPWSENATYSQWVMLANIARGANESYDLSQGYSGFMNGILTLEEPIGRLDFKKASLNFLNRINDDVLKKMRFGAKDLHLSLNYCQNFTREGFRYLYQNYQPEMISLVGCRQVDDSFFEDHPLLTTTFERTQVLDLRGTSVSMEMVERLKAVNPKLTVNYDNKFLIRLTGVDRLIPFVEGFEKVPNGDRLKRALLEFEKTNYFPVLDVPLALEILKHKEKFPNKLNKYCVSFLIANLNIENAFDVYNFATDNNLTTLQHTCLAFMGQFNSPDYPDLWNKLSDEAKYRSITIFAEKHDEYVKYLGQDSYIPEKETKPITQEDIYKTWDNDL